jgi:hypothetical protein
MTIRKRIDEAIALEAKFPEASLILSLVAVAAAARKKYPRPTHYDSTAFTTYLNERGGDFLKFTYKGKQKSVADVLYEEYRCNLIHEAELPIHVKINDKNDDMSIGLNGDEITLGRGWCGWLISAVVHDDNLSEDFNDIKESRIDDVRFTVEDREKWLNDLEDKYKISLGRLYLVIWTMKTAGISKLKAMSDDQIRDWGKKIKANPDIVGLNQGAIVGLSRFTSPFPDFERPDSFFDKTGISGLGLKLLRELLAGLI